METVEQAIAWFEKLKDNGESTTHCDFAIARLREFLAGTNPEADPNKE